MAASREIVKRVKDSFVNKRGSAIQRAEDRRLEVYSAVDGIREIDNELSQTAFNLLTAVTKGANVDEELASQKARNGELRLRRAEMLRSAGYPEDYTDVRYECPLCNDNGYVGINMCSCLKNAIALEALQASGVGVLAKSQSFDNFSFDYYKDGDRATVERNFNTLRDYAEGFMGMGDDSYLLVGGTGLGKTHLSTAVAVKVIERGFDVVYETMQTLMDDFSENQFRGGSADSVARYYDADLLIVDDLGSELTNQFTVSVLYNLINQRMNKSKATVFSTNLSQKELRERYADRVVSRLLGVYKPLVFKGNDIRAQKLMEGRR